MDKGLKDITLYCTTHYQAGTDEYIKEIALYNYISDLYIVCLRGYKPPGVTCISIEAKTPKKWDRSYKQGSLILTSALFNYQEYITLSTKDQYRLILEMLHETMLELSNEYKWDNSSFINAYNEVIERDYSFKLVYPVKKSMDRKKDANAFVTKTERNTWINSAIIIDGVVMEINLLEKKNFWWYDCAYKFAKESRWLTNDKFGFSFKPGNISIYYSVSDRKTYFEKDSIECNQEEIEKVLKANLLL